MIEKFKEFYKRDPFICIAVCAAFIWCFGIVIYGISNAQIQHKEKKQQQEVVIEEVVTNKTIANGEQTKVKDEKKSKKSSHFAAFKKELFDGLGVMNDNIGYVINLQNQMNDAQDKMIDTQKKMLKAEEEVAVGIVQNQELMMQNQEQLGQKIIEMNNRLSGIEEKLDLIMQKIELPNDDSSDKILQDVISTFDYIQWDKFLNKMYEMKETLNHPSKYQSPSKSYRFDKHQFNGTEKTVSQIIEGIEEDAQKKIDDEYNELLEKEQQKHKGRNPVLFVYPTYDEDGNAVYNL